MSGEQELKGPDFAAGVPLALIPDGGMLLGHANGKPVLLTRTDGEVFAIGATCTHYSGPLGEGLLVGHTVRCPWHHACFDVRTGEALRAPALDPVSRWEVEHRGTDVVVTSEIKGGDGATPATTGSAWRDNAGAASVQRIVIIGAGVAGNAAAEMLRRQGFSGSITMIGADAAKPYDRPNLSKDYLAGTAQESWLPLRTPEFYEKHNIEVMTSTVVSSIDTAAKSVALGDGQTRPYDRLLLATGATPIALNVPGADLPHVFYLRTLDDSHRIIAAAARAKSVAVIGASFIGLEVAASLKTRGLDVHVIAPDAIPLQKVFGDKLGAHVQSLHEEKGVKFSLGKSVTSIGASAVALNEGEAIVADLVVVGIGVRPNLDLAKAAGLEVENGVMLDEFLESSVKGIYAAGDIANFPYRTGDRIRVEHFVVAERQGQFAARNMLGAREPYDDIPFFWSAHFGTEIRYVGHASKIEESVVGGSIDKGDALVGYKEKGKMVAFASLGRDFACLQAEEALEENDTKTMSELTAK
jgi:NADPH-dependent 2,4-dienoyl-CoA reductase/sulfur reductase-like enzyme/nitrite reductase/ring-hydroxylating ferredoxin subunit